MPTQAGHLRLIIIAQNMIDSAQATLFMLIDTVIACEDRHA